MNLQAVFLLFILIVMKHDILTEEDIRLLVDRFYEKVVIDPEIGFIFSEIIGFSWNIHIPIMYSFWNGVLLGKQGYSGNPMQKHIEIDYKIALEKKHFDTWLRLWEETIHAHFEGPKAAEAISRATNIAALMQVKIERARTARQ